jgi:predicted AlkP superfamily phosphohydrolase/phosphomutase
MVVFKLVDNLQHKAWKYLDPRFKDRHPRRAEMAAQCFSKLDDALGNLFDYADTQNATVVIMSDHGHGSLEGKAQPNLLLQRWGYLTLRTPWEQGATRASHWLHRLTKGKVTRFEQGARGVERDLAVDWSRTRACVMHAGIYGFLYINLKGRGPIGIVDQSEYEALRDEIAAKLHAAEATGKDGRPIRIFTEVHKPEELYGCPREENSDLPDLLLAPQPGLAVVRKIRGGSPVRWSAESRIEGTHRLEGVFAMGGPCVKRGERMRAHIVDLTPTTLAALGLRVPIDMEGRVLSEAFTTPPMVEHEPPIKKVFEGHAEVYTDDERRVLEQRLSDLGYLE